MSLAAIALAAAAPLQPQAILTIAPSHRLVEGVASDGRTLFVSSILDRQILACTTERCRKFATLPAGLHPFAIAWDSTRNALWVAANCPEGIAGIKACERGALLGYSATGKLRTRIASASGAFHPGDVTAAPAGVFVSDSANGAVYRLNAKGQALEALVPPGVGKSGQGMAVDATGTTLIVADYSQGIAAIDLATKARTLLLKADGKPLRGIDGVVRCGDSFYGLFNYESPGTLHAFRREGDTIVVSQPMPIGPPDPTQLAVDGDRLLMVTDSGWATLDKKDFVRTQGAPIWAVTMPEGCAAK